MLLKKSEWVLITVTSVFPLYTSPAETGRTQLECGAQSGQKSTPKEVARLHDSCSKDDSGCDTVDVDTAVEAPGGCQNPPKAYVADDVFPQPRLPFPCVSGLASNEQRAYLNILCSKKLRVPPQVTVISF